MNHGNVLGLPLIHEVRAALDVQVAVATERPASQELRIGAKLRISGHCESLGSHVFQAVLQRLRSVAGRGELVVPEHRSGTLLVGMAPGLFLRLKDIAFPN